MNKKILILIFVWINLFIGLCVFVKVKPQIIEREIIVEKRIEVPVEKIVYKEGKEIVEKKIYIGRAQIVSSDSAFVRRF